MESSKAPSMKLARNAGFFHKNFLGHIAFLAGQQEKRDQKNGPYGPIKVFSSNHVCTTAIYSFSSITNAP